MAAAMKLRLFAEIHTLKEAGIGASMECDLYMSVAALEGCVRRQWSEAQQTLSDDRLAQLIEAVESSVPKEPPMDLDAELGPPRVYARADTPTCGICLEIVKETQRTFAIKCRHVFHDGCLRDWVNKGCKNTCPLDREILLRDPADEPASRERADRSVKDVQ